MPQPASSPASTATPRRRLHRPYFADRRHYADRGQPAPALTSVGPLLEQIQQQLALSATAAGLINSLPLILFAVLSPLTPALAKRIGIERTLGLALALLVCGIVLRSLPQDAMLWPGSVLIGAAIAFANVVLPTLVKRDFPHRAAAMIATYAAVMSLVAAIASGLAVPLASWPTSAGGSLLLCWGLPAAGAVGVLPQLRRSATPSPKSRSQQSCNAIALLGQRTAGLASSDVHGAAIDRLHTIIGWFSAFAASHGTSAQQAGFELFVYQVVAIVANFVMVVILPRARGSAGNSVRQLAADLHRRRGLLVQPASSLVWLTFAGLGRGVRWCWRCRSLDCAVSIIIRRRCCRVWRNPSVIC